MSIFEVSTRLPNTYQFNNSPSGSHSANSHQHHHHQHRHSHYSNQSSSAMANLSAAYSGSPSAHSTRRLLQPTISSANHHNHYSSVNNSRSSTAAPRSSSVTSPSPSRFYSDSSHFSNNIDNNTTTAPMTSTDIPFTYTRTGSNNTSGGSSKYLSRVLSSNPSSKPKPHSAYFSTNPSRPDHERSNPSSVEYIQLNPGSSTASATVLPVFYQRESKSSFPLINNNRASMLEIGPLTYRSNSALAQSYDPVASKPSNNNNTSDRLMKMYHRNMHNPSNSNFLFNQTNSLDRQNSEPVGTNQYQIKLTPKDFSVIKSVKLRNDMLSKSNENETNGNVIVMNNPKSPPHGNLVMLQNKLDEMTTSDRPYSSNSQDRHSANGMYVDMSETPLTNNNNNMTNGRQKSILVSKKRMGPGGGYSTMTTPGSASSTPKKTVTFAD